jgi:hypothetical protein
MVQRLILLLFVVALLPVKVAYTQQVTTGIYVTVDDYLNNTPVRCSTVTLKKSSITAHFEDGTEKTYEAGSFWGFIGPRNKRAKLPTSCRYYNGTYYGIVTTGDLWFYEDIPSGWDLSETSDTIYVSLPFKYMITKGINGEPLELRYNDNLYKKFFSLIDPDYVVKMKAVSLSHIQHYFECYNNMKAGNPGKDLMVVSRREVEDRPAAGSREFK